LYPAEFNPEHFLITTPGQCHKYDCCNGTQHVLISVSSLTLITAYTLMYKLYVIDIKT